MKWKGLQWDSWKDVYVLYLNGSWILRLDLMDSQKWRGKENWDKLGLGIRKLALECWEHGHLNNSSYGLY